MNKQYDCNVILDLLPLSIDQLVSEETEQVIQNHLKECESCRQVYEEMNNELELTSAKPKKRKKHRCQKKNVIRTWILGYLLFLGLILAFCVMDVVLR